jgi:hypothetical protein
MYRGSATRLTLDKGLGVRTDYWQAPSTFVLKSTRISSLQPIKAQYSLLSNNFSEELQTNATPLPLVRQWEKRR